MGVARVKVPVGWSTMNHMDSSILERVPRASDEIHKRLETAVIKVFSEVDFYQANMREIARQAGMSFGTIYKYYKNKDHLLFAFIRYWFSMLQDRIRDHLQGIDDTREKLRKLIWVQLEYFERNEDIGRIIWIRTPNSAWMADKTYESNSLLEIILEILQEGRARGVIDSNIRTSMCVNLITSTISWAFMDWIYKGKERSLVDELEPIFEFVWCAVGNNGG
jgi:AcrR family transcriptional regulator